MDESDVLIIGGGVIGLFSAYFLSQENYSVTIMDAGLIPGQQASSFGNAGMVVPSHFMPLATRAKLLEGFKSLLPGHTSIGVHIQANRDFFFWLLKFYQSTHPGSIEEKSKLLASLSLESRNLFLGLQHRHPIPWFLNFSGIQMVCKSPKTLKAEIKMAGNAEKHGIPTEIWTPEQLEEHNPGLNPEVSGAVYYPLDGVLDPFPMQKSLLDLLIARGVRILSETPVTAIRTEKNKISEIVSHQKSFRAKTILLAGGDQSGLIAEMIGLRLPLLPGKGISYQVRKSGMGPTLPTLLQDSHIAITPYENHIRVASQFILGNRSSGILLTDLLNMNRTVKDHFRSWDMPRPKKQNAWAGFRPVSPDGLPFVGYSSVYQNLIVATGHAMIGLSLAPVTGKMVEELINKRATTRNEAIKLLKPNRFGNKF